MESLLHQTPNCKCTICIPSPKALHIALTLLFGGEGGLSAIKQIMSVCLSNCRVKYYPQVQKLTPSVILSFQHYFTLRVTFVTLQKYCTTIALKPVTAFCTVCILPSKHWSRASEKITWKNFKVSQTVVKENYLVNVGTLHMWFFSD